MLAELPKTKAGTIREDAQHLRRWCILYACKGVVQHAFRWSNAYRAIDAAEAARAWCEADGSRYVGLADERSMVVDVASLDVLHEHGDCGFSPRAAWQIVDLARAAQQIAGD